MQPILCSIKSEGFDIFASDTFLQEVSPVSVETFYASLSHSDPIPEQPVS